MKICLIDSAHGIYIPTIFVQGFTWGKGIDEWSGIDKEDIEILRTGPDHPEYWDAWDMVLNNARFVDEKGRCWWLEQDEDLFIVYISELQRKLIEHGWIGDDSSYFEEMLIAHDQDFTMALHQYKMLHSEEFE